MIDAAKLYGAMDLINNMVEPFQQFGTSVMVPHRGQQHQRCDSWFLQTVIPAKCKGTSAGWITKVGVKPNQINQISNINF